MKKMNNKGFSLVELIIVIAIMAILAGAIAPALIRYIDKSRKSNDVSSCKTIKTAVETAMANEETYELLTTSGAKITITGNTATSGGGGVSIADLSGNAMTGTAATTAATEIGANIGEKTPKIKYTKSGQTNFTVEITTGGTVKVLIGTKEICPELDPEYQ